MRWAGDSSRFTFLYNQRGHQVLRIVGVDAANGKAEALIDEHSDTFIDYSGKGFHEYLDDSGEILWMSERDGWNHLYLYDARTGQLKNQVTRGEWVVRGGGPRGPRQAADLVPRRRHPGRAGPLLHPLLPGQLRRHRPGRAHRRRRQPLGPLLARPKVLSRYVVARGFAAGHGIAAD